MVSGNLRGGRGDASEFGKALSAFLNKLSSFKPRKYVAEKLTMKESEKNTLLSISRDCHKRDHNLGVEGRCSGQLRRFVKYLMRRYPTVFNPLWSLTYAWIVRGDEKYFGSEYTDRVQAFRTIYDENRWQSLESRSGHGSTVAYTRGLRKSLEQYLTKLNVKSFLDAPCGDFNWMRHLVLPPQTQYIGGDIIPELVYNFIPELVYNLQNEYGGEHTRYCDRPAPFRRPLALPRYIIPLADCRYCKGFDKLHGIENSIPSNDYLRLPKKKRRRKGRRISIYQLLALWSRTKWHQQLVCDANDRESWSRKFGQRDRWSFFASPGVHMSIIRSMARAIRTSPILRDLQLCLVGRGAGLFLGSGPPPMRSTNKAEW